MLFPMVFKRLLGEEKFPMVGHEYADPITLILETVVLEVRENKILKFKIIGRLIGGSCNFGVNF